MEDEIKALERLCRRQTEHLRKLLETAERIGPPNDLDEQYTLLLLLMRVLESNLASVGR